MRVEEWAFIAFLAIFGYYIYMKIELCTDKNVWDAWFLSQKEASFLQSWDWGEFQTRMGHKAVRLLCLSSEDKVRYWQGFEHRLHLGIRYLYVPRIISLSGEERIALYTFAREAGYAFVRIEPLNDIAISSSVRVQPVRCRQPQYTLRIALAKDHESLLQEMHSKTRYNIRLAEKKGVVIRYEKNAELFWQLNEQTTSRDAFRSHGKMYYQHMIDLPSVRQLTAYYNDVPIASNILVFTHDTCTYLHGASANEYRNVMAPYLLQWEGMKFGKAQGCTWYDMWGVAAPASKQQKGAVTFHQYTWQQEHPFNSITRFKAGFGRDAISYASSYDMVVSTFFYSVYSFGKKLTG